MEVGFAALKERSDAVVHAIAAKRSARNLASRRRRIERTDERAKTRDQLDKKRRDDREANGARGRIRIKVEQADRPRYRGGTPRRLYHRQVHAMLKGTTGLSDSRGPDRLHSIHYAFTARGFKSSGGRRWRTGEAERAALYIAREDALEGGEHGWWSNIAADRNELAAHYRTSEALEKHDRANANVYISEVIALPAELTARQRRYAVRRICRFFEGRGLAYTVGIHLPDASGDQRNHHCHIVYSLRPCHRTAAYEWSFALGKEGDINTRDGIQARRLAVVRAINDTLHAAGIDKRYTHLSNKARGMLPPVEGKVGKDTTWARRRLAAIEERRARLAAWAGTIAGVRHAVVDGADKVQDACRRTGAVLEDLARAAAARAGDRRLADARASCATQFENMLCILGDSVAAGATAVRERRQGTLAQFANMHSNVRTAAAHANTGGIAFPMHGTLARIGTSTADLTSAGAKRIAAIARRIDRARKLEHVSLAITEIGSRGIPALAKTRAVLTQQLDVMVADLGIKSPSAIEAAKTGVLHRLDELRAATDRMSAAAQRTIARLYSAKPRVVEAKPVSAAMATIRAYSAVATPSREGVDRASTAQAGHAVEAADANAQARAMVGAFPPPAAGPIDQGMLEARQEHLARQGSSPIAATTSHPAARTSSQIDVSDKEQANELPNKSTDEDHGVRSRRSGLRLVGGVASVRGLHARGLANRPWSGEGILQPVQRTDERGEGLRDHGMPSPDTERDLDNYVTPAQPNQRAGRGISAQAAQAAREGHSTVVTKGPHRAAPFPSLPTRGPER